MKCVIVGAGPIGTGLAEELAKLGHEIHLASRSGKAVSELPKDIAIHACDATDSQSLSAIAERADLLVHAFGTPYAEWEKSLLPGMDGFIAAALTQKTRVLFVDNFLAYGDNQGIPISEATPERPNGKKGALRAQAAAKLMAEHKAERLKVCVARAPDVFGPRVVNSVLGPNVFENFINGKTIELLGNLTMPHSFIYIKDLIRALVQLATGEDEHYGKVWHLPSHQPVTQKQMSDILRAVTNKSITVKAKSASSLAWSSMFDPKLKELAELMYMWEKPFVVNHSRFATTFGERTTPHEQAIFDTLEWYKRRAGMAARLGH